MNIIQKAILAEYPDYDFNRYRFKAGDYVTTLDGAEVIVEYSALDYIQGYVIKRSLKYREKGSARIYYTDLPYYTEFMNKEYKVSKSLKWEIFNIVRDGNTVVLLTKEVGHQKFHGFVLETDNSYYLHTGIYLENPYAGYIS